MAAAFLASLALAYVSMAIFGAGTKGTLVGLMVTARCSYCFFIPAYVGGALATVFGPFFRFLSKRGRDLGLAFASAHLVHAFLIAWLYHISPTPPVSTSSAAFFGIALLLTYLLALLSIPKLTTRLPPRLWWLLLTFGMDYIALAFLRDFLRVDPFGGSLEHSMGYLPFVMLGFAAALVRIAWYAKRIHQRWLTPQPAG